MKKPGLHFKYDPVFVGNRPAFAHVAGEVARAHNYFKFVPPNPNINIYVAWKILNDSLRSLNQNFDALFLGVLICIILVRFERLLASLHSSKFGDSRP